MAHLSRRRFLAASGTVAAAGDVAPTGTDALGPTGAAAAGVAPGRRALISGPFPRTLVFRQAEVLAQLRPYATWAPLFEPFGGLIAKLLPEERTDTVTTRNIPYLVRYKREHPGTVALLHFNGRARRPAYRTTGWFAGDWLYRAGATLTTAVGAAATTLTVDDTAPFVLAADAFGHVEIDLVVTGRRPDGRPDFGTAEHVVCTAVDAATGTLTVTRAGYGSTAVAFPAGAYVAQHVSVGPWSSRDTRLWLYNFATTAPRGPDGLGAGDRVAAEMAADFGSGGRLAALDGLEFDIFALPDAIRPFVDADGDGVADAGYAGDVDAYTAGQAAFTAGVRAALGPNRVLSVDSGTQRPDPASVGGIEWEGFPTYDDPTLTKWSQGLASLVRWRTTGAGPRLSYPLAKSRPVTVGQPDPRRFRVAFAAALLAGTQLSFWDEPSGTTSLSGLELGPGSGIFRDTFTVWDELLGGTLGRADWLGAPLAATVRPVPGTAADLFAGGGVGFTPAWLAGTTVTGGVATRQTPAALLLTPSGRDGLELVLPRVTAPAADVVLRFDVTTEPEPGLSAGAGRRVDVSITTGAAGSLNRFVVGPTRSAVVSSAVVTSGRPVRIELDVLGHAPVTLRRVVLQAVPDVAYREFEGGAVFANPSSKPYTFDVSALLPGATFRRLTATAGQDTTVNDGTTVGPTLTVAPADAVVVCRA